MTEILYSYFLKLTMSNEPLMHINVLVVDGWSLYLNFAVNEVVRLLTVT